MPTFSVGDRLAPGAHAVGVVVAHVGEHGDGGVDHVGGVVATEHADLDHGHVDRDVGEPGEGGGGEDLEVAGGDPGDLLDGGHRADGGPELVVGDRLAVPRRSAR